MSAKRKVLVDGVEYSSISAAAAAIDAAIPSLCKALRLGQPGYLTRHTKVVHSIGYAPAPAAEPEPEQPEPIAAPEPMPESPARAPGSSLMRGICTHRLGTYGGMRE